MAFLNQRARELMQMYCAGLAKANGVADTSTFFSISNPVETQLRKALIDSSAFLKDIYCADVDQLSGQVIAVGNNQLFTGRKAGGRFMRAVGVDGNTYKLVETDSGAYLSWDLLSTWANAGGTDKEFFKLVQQATNEAFAADMLRIGFNGTSVATTTDPEANPNGEDVNIGWQEIVRQFNGGSQIIVDDVTLGAGGDFSTLDSMASDLVNTLIPAQYRNDPRLVVLVGSDLVAAEQYRLYQEAITPTENLAAQMLSKTIAGRKAYVPPFMPGKRMVVTTLKNLHIYTQRNTRQRKTEFSEDRKQYENKYLRNEGYAVEYPELYAAFDENHVTIGATGEPVNERIADAVEEIAENSAPVAEA